MCVVVSERAKEERNHRRDPVSYVAGGYAYMFFYREHRIFCIRIVYAAVGSGCSEICPTYPEYRSRPRTDRGSYIPGNRRPQYPEILKYGAVFNPSMIKSEGVTHLRTNGALEIKNAQ